ncbi:MAG: hypothetical protein HDS04_05985 [Bacteroides sp.]|nr:hypothetical protein [Bacteroides sp.]
MPLKYTLLPLFLALMAAGCSSEPEPMRIQRLDSALADGEMTAADSAAFKAWSEIAAFSGSPAEYAGRTAPFEALVIGSIGSLDSVERVLGYALDDDGLKAVGVVSPYSQSVVTHPDGYLFIALNHYLGPESAAYAGFPEYLRRQKIMERMPVDAVMGVIASKNEPQFRSDATLLNHLLYRGALLNQTLRALPPKTAEAVVLGMTEQDYDWCAANEAKIWKTLIERKLLYSSDPEAIDRLTRPAPSSPLIALDAPGQAALYCALKLAQAYEDATGKEALPEPDFYNNRQTLVKSSYAPN